VAPERFRYCLDQLRRLDHDRYLSVLLAPAERRAPLAALGALEAELDHIPQTVSEPMLGQIRFQWWRDTLEQMTPTSHPGHEVAEALVDTLFVGGLSPSDLLPMIDLRSAQLTAEPFATTRDLVTSVEQLVKVSLEARLALMAGSKTVGIDMLVAEGIVRHLRRIPFEAGAERLSLPLDLMRTYDVDPHDMFAGVARPGFKALVAELRHLASERYKLGAGVRVTNVSELHVLLPASLVPLYLRKMAATDFDLLHHSCEVPAFRRQLRLIRVLATKRF